MKCKRNSDGRAIDHHSLQVMRQQAIKAVREGQTAQSVAAAFGVNVRSVFRWLADFASGGQNALLAKPIPGRPSKVSAEEMRWLAQAVRENTPLQYKFEFGLWTLSLIRALIKRQFGKELSIATVSRLMKMLGFSAQKPLYQAWQQDAALVRQWESETYPAIRAKARAAGATIYFADESGIRSDYHTGTTWAPRGQTPVVEVTGRRFSLNMISAVSPQGEFRFMLHEGSVTATVFREFLKRLMIGATKPVFVIVDGHPIHKAKLVRAYVESLKGQLELFYLPPYSPQLNPDEQVWAHVKRQVSKRLVQDKDEMKRLALGALRRIQRLPNLVKSFFRQPECQYALA
ncbi:IS630 family transposase [Azoarcus sp. DD4]|uniref:IS630 family transposase n=1 Tax=Azoarcus sp. DD4 TaxID=2027405 RepID=UPI001127D444|nr:IS630 family transposase [Azoarcus sp. DD4]QDF96455.1 IS630 family transposase [Azoarcus sp. DD4]QDF96915.1 IS630 family transposase [Azoarcus sp. DD4]QDF98079.1 IS630 family transposase [Azoarcus sp. DD4]QDF98428.1 IS630 family transposase [Azoarcus sp. DD4]